MLNEYYRNIGLKGFLARYGIVNAVRRGAFMACPMHRVSDYAVRKLLWQQRAAGRVRRYLSYADSDPEGLTYPETTVPEEPIWIFWNTGIASAPELVKRCYASVVRYGGREVIVLDDRNVDRYVRFPEELLRRRAEGSLSIAHYADMLRFALLERYGGMWIDATVLLTGPIPEDIAESGFFAMRNSMGLIENPALFACWFLHARAHDATVRGIRNVLFAYFRRERHIMEYLTTNLVITELVRHTGVERSIPYYGTDYSEYLVRCLPEPFCEERLRRILSLTPIHKLTYKLDPAIGEEDTLYSHILHELG